MAQMTKSQIFFKSDQIPRSGRCLKSDQIRQMAQIPLFQIFFKSDQILPFEKLPKSDQIHGIAQKSFST
jgi:hypothetical protein